MLAIAVAPALAMLALAVLINATLPLAMLTLTVFALPLPMLAVAGLTTPSPAFATLAFTMSGTFPLTLPMLVGFRQLDAIIHRMNCQGIVRGGNDSYSTEDKSKDNTNSNRK